MRQLGPSLHARTTSSVRLHRTSRKQGLLVHGVLLRLDAVWTAPYFLACSSHDHSTGCQCSRPAIINHKPDVKKQMLMISFSHCNQFVASTQDRLTAPLQVTRRAAFLRALHVHTPAHAHTRVCTLVYAHFRKHAFTHLHTWVQQQMVSGSSAIASLKVKLGWNAPSVPEAPRAVHPFECPRLCAPYMATYER